MVAAAGGHRLAGLYARLLDRPLPRLRRVALRNLSLALPELDRGGRREIADGVFRSIARVLVSFARFPTIRRGNLDGWIRCEGVEHVEEASAEAAACCSPPPISATGS